MSAIADDAIHMGWTLHELKVGSMTGKQAKNLYETGDGLSIHIILGTDSMSIWSALSVMTIRTPQEKTPGAVLHWLKEKMRLGIIRNLRWYDTRDMSCDGHTIGTMDRRILLELQHGKYRPVHAVKDYNDPAYKPKETNKLKNTYFNPTTGSDNNHPYAHIVKFLLRCYLVTQAVLSHNSAVTLGHELMRVTGEPILEQPALREPAPPAGPPEWTCRGVPAGPPEWTRNPTRQPMEVPLPLAWQLGRARHLRSPRHAHRFKLWLWSSKSFRTAAARYGRTCAAMPALP